MDKDLESLITLARKRGSRHVKREVSPDELADSMAELGVYLLAEYERVKKLKADASAAEGINDIQQRIDHFRRAIFAFKRKMYSSGR